MPAYKIIATGTWHPSLRLKNRTTQTRCWADWYHRYGCHCFPPPMFSLNRREAGFFKTGLDQPDL